MPEKKVMTGNKAVAIAARLARPKVIAAYPITPQTAIIEYLAEFVAAGELNARYIPTGSEMEVGAATNGASRAGVRVFTATSSQGLLLMAEQIYSAGLRRLPIVMANVNRTLGPSWNILCSHEDSLILRDWPWLQLYASDAQEALDAVLQAYKIAERIRLPVLVCLDGFFLSHSPEAVEIPDQKLVDQYLGEYQPELKVDTENPRVFEPSIDDAWTTEFRYNLMTALGQEAKKIGEEAFREFEELFGRQYSLIEGYNLDTAEIVLVGLGTHTGTIRSIIQNRKDVGLLKIRMFRPFPEKEIREALKAAKKIAILDRDMQGILAQEVKNAVSQGDNIESFVVGLGGRDITPSVIHDIIETTTRASTFSPIWIDLKKEGGDESFSQDRYPAPEVILSKGSLRPEIPAEEFIAPGHNACQGCGGVLALRYSLKGLGKNTVVLLPACCWSVVNGRFPVSAVIVPLQNVCFEVVAGEASGMKAGLDMDGKKSVNVLGFAGDGGVYDIGIQCISSAAERNEDIIIACYNNEAYMNTGIQRSSATPFGSWTTTTPSLKLEKKKDMMAIMAAHRIPYAATASIAFPEDMISKFQKASRIKGFKYIEIFSSCPPGWRLADTGISVRVARLAVACRVWPLYEVENGERYIIGEMPAKIPVKRYLEIQGRFSKLSPEMIVKIQEFTDKEMQRLEKLASMQ